jgi:hypothetical protein
MVSRMEIQGCPCPYDLKVGLNWIRVFAYFNGGGRLSNRVRARRGAGKGLYWWGQMLADFRLGLSRSVWMGVGAWPG